MRILILSDIHANLNALDAVMASSGSVDAVWCLGDLVGYGPDPNEVIEKIHWLPNLVCLLGNHDAAALGQLNLAAFNEEARQNIEWLEQTLTSSSLHFLQSLPVKNIIDNVTLVHGSPRNPIWEYLLDTYTVLFNFDYFDTQLCLVGHTHLPMVFYAPENGSHDVEWRSLVDGEKIQLDGRVILNPGSVGQPRDHDPRASYAIFDTETNIWEAHRVKYDIESVQQRIIQSGLPRRHALRLTEGW
jgi:diadenosine tetraphosphatase ApaH/serine/threonine PP2A family protein phosphatase